MSPSTFVFYCANVVLVTAYLVIAALSLLPGGVTGKVQQGSLLRSLTVAFFLSGAALHADLAVHVLALIPFFDPAGKITWDLTVITSTQMLAVFSSLVLIQREKRRQRHSPR